MRRTALTLAACVVLAAPAPAAAQPADARARALAHFKQGEAYFKARAYDLAVKEYEAAYALVPRPALLFNIGLAYQELGDKARALAYLRRYVDSAPDGAAREEARARTVALERALAAEEARRTAAERAAELTRDAAARRGAGEIEPAVASYEQAYQLTRDPELLFEIAETYREADRAPRAIASYERYLAEAPAGPRRADARSRLAALADAEAGPPVGVDLTLPPARSPADPVRDRPPRRRWLWLATGGAALAAGLAADFLPGSSTDGKLGAIDFVPIALYGAGATFVIVGVF